MPGDVDPKTASGGRRGDDERPPVTTTFSDADGVCGVVTVKHGVLWRVRLDRGGEAMAHLSGGLSHNDPRVRSGCRVLVDLSPLNPARGRILKLLR